MINQQKIQSQQIKFVSHLNAGKFTNVQKVLEIPRKWTVQHLKIFLVNLIQFEEIKLVHGGNQLPNNKLISQLIEHNAGQEIVFHVLHQKEKQKITKEVVSNQQIKLLEFIAQKKKEDFLHLQNAKYLQQKEIFYSNQQQEKIKSSQIERRVNRFHAQDLELFIFQAIFIFFGFGSHFLSVMNICLLILLGINLFFSVKKRQADKNARHIQGMIESNNSRRKSKSYKEQIKKLGIILCQFLYSYLCSLCPNWNINVFYQMHGSRIQDIYDAYFKENQQQQKGEQEVLEQKVSLVNQ